MKTAENYITEWCDKTYGGGKELGDWTTSEVMKFANDYAKEKSCDFAYWLDTVNEGSDDGINMAGYKSLYEVFINENLDDASDAMDNLEDAEF